MRGWALFAYRIASGLVVAGSMDRLLSDPATGVGWHLIGSAAALALGLVLHQRGVARSKGRRWRKTLYYPWLRDCLSRWFIRGWGAGPNQRAKMASPWRYGALVPRVEDRTVRPRCSAPK